MEVKQYTSMVNLVVSFIIMKVLNIEVLLYGPKR